MLSIGGMITDGEKPKYSEKYLFYSHLITNSKR
jgi:hypothetical protein